jgi:hypothetical protein
MGDLQISRRLCFFFIFALAWGLAGCNRQDADHLSRIGQKLAAGLGDVKESLAVGWHGVVPAMGLQARVEARLYWDKALADAAIEVKANGNEIELTGTVKDQTQQHRAVELAETTSGVEKVVENLQVNSQ